MPVLKSSKLGYLVWWRWGCWEGEIIKGKFWRASELVWWNLALAPACYLTSSRESCLVNSHLHFHISNSSSHLRLFLTFVLLLYFEVIVWFLCFSRLSCQTIALSYLHASRGRYARQPRGHIFIAYQHICHVNGRCWGEAYLSQICQKHTPAFSFPLSMFKMISSESSTARYMYKKYLKTCLDLIVPGKTYSNQATRYATGQKFVCQPSYPLDPLPRSSCPLQPRWDKADASITCDSLVIKFRQPWASCFIFDIWFIFKISRVGIYQLPKAPI